MIEMKINSVRFSPKIHQFIVILEEKTGGGNRCLPIWIGALEADSIVLRLQQAITQRPLTHDLISSIIESLGASINYTLVDELQGNTFHAKINLLADEKEINVDSRPSDAIALALQATVPIYVDESVLDKAGIFMEQFTGKQKPVDETGGIKETGGKVDEHEIKRLSAYNDFIEGLNLDGLGEQ